MILRTDRKRHSVAWGVCRFNNAPACMSLLSYVDYLRKMNSSGDVSQKESFKKSAQEERKLLTTMVAQQDVRLLLHRKQPENVFVEYITGLDPELQYAGLIGEGDLLPLGGV